MKTTLTLIRSHRPCQSGWQTLLKHVGADYDTSAPINLLTILESNGVQDMLWCLRATTEDSRQVAVRLAIAFAEEALPVFEAQYPDDMRPRNAIQAARGHLAGAVSVAELQAAGHAVRTAAFAATYADAARAAYAAYDAAYDATAYDAAHATYAAAAAAAAAAADAAAGVSQERLMEIIKMHLQPQ